MLGTTGTVGTRKCPFRADNVRLLYRAQSVSSGRIADQGDLIAKKSAGGSRSAVLVARTADYAFDSNPC